MHVAFRHRKFAHYISVITQSGCYPNFMLLDCSTHPEPYINIDEMTFGVDTCFHQAGTCCPADTRNSCLIPAEEASPEYYSEIQNDCRGLAQCFINVNRTTAPEDCPIPGANYTNFLTIDFSCAEIIPTTVLPTTEALTTLPDTTTVQITTQGPELTTQPDYIHTSASNAFTNTDETNTPHVDITTETDNSTKNLYSTSQTSEKTEQYSTSKHPVYTAEPCPEEIPFYKNWSKCVLHILPMCIAQSSYTYLSMNDTCVCFISNMLDYLYTPLDN